MDPQLMASLLNSIVFLGARDNPTKEEILAYNKLLSYAGSVAAYNQRVVDNAIRDFDEEVFKRASEKVA